MKARLLDPSFRYVPSHSTDIRKTFARVRRELAAALPAGRQGRQEPGERAGKRVPNLLRRQAS